MRGGACNAGVAGTGAKLDETVESGVVLEAHEMGWWDDKGLGGDW